MKRTPISPSSTLDQQGVSSAITIAPNVNGDTHGHEMPAGPLRVEPGAAPHSEKSVFVFSPPLLELPRHTFVSAQPFSSTKVNKMSSGDIAGKIRAGGTTIGDETNIHRPAADKTCPENNSNPPAAVGGVREHRQQQRHPFGRGPDQRQEKRPGVVLAFHSSFFSLGFGGPPSPPAAGDRSRVLQQERPRERRPATEVIVDSPAVGMGSAVGAAAAVVVEDDESEVRPDHHYFQGHGMASSDSDTTRTWQRGHNGDGIAGGTGGGGAEVRLPGRFGYSLGEPFHSQRVASVKFISTGATTTRGETRVNKGGLSDLRLVTGEYWFVSCGVVCQHLSIEHVL